MSSVEYSGFDGRLRLYDYFRSTASYRVRIALNLKKLDYCAIPVDLRIGEQNTAAYRATNPQQLVPALQTGAQLLTQSLAIIEYLDEVFPENPLLPIEPLARAGQRAMANVIACDIHPINNLRVLNYLREHFSANDGQVNGWIAHWISLGFAALQEQAVGNKFLSGDSPGLADICLIPQVYNALRFHAPLTNFPAITAIYHRCLELEAFKKASPDQVLATQEAV